MKGQPVYTEFHPRWHRPHMSTYWWVKRWHHLAFILREVSSVFVIWFVIFLLMLVNSLSSPESYRAFLTWAAHPVVVAVNLVALAFVLFHAITFFNLTPKAMVVKIGAKRAPAGLVIGGHYVAWIAVSAALVFLLVRS